mgnify:FL=1|jgi:peptide/nickel transport system ATP-binding protein
MKMPRTIVEFVNLHTYFDTADGVVKAVNGVSFRIREGETVALVGESGCGKSVTAMSLMGLLENTTGRIVDGEIRFDGKNTVNMSRAELRRIRGKDVSMIFQEPMSSLNPVLTIGEQMAEPMIEHLHMSRKEAHAKAVELIRMVGIPRAEAIARSYPHELSGGMLQRIMIAIALCCKPKLLIADEPTTALDVTVQAQILDLLRELKRQLEMAILLITHDLGVVAEMADSVIVMYCGKVIEQAPVLSLFQHPRHPYTQGLLKARPSIGRRTERLYSIPGQVPSPIGLGNSCYFSDRCDRCMDVCLAQQPPLRAVDDRHSVACWLYEEGIRDVRSAARG